MRARGGVARRTGCAGLTLLVVVPPAGVHRLPSRSGAVLEPLGDGSILLFGGAAPGFTDRTDTWIYGRVGPP